VVRRLGIIFLLLINATCARYVGGVSNAIPDSGPADSRSADSRPADSGPADFAPTDSGLSDTGLSDAASDGAIDSRADANAPISARGERDSSFGNSGVVTFEGGQSGRSSWVGGAVVDSAGRLVVVGSLYNQPSQFDLFVARFLPNGSADASFGNLGIVFWTANRYDLGRSIMLDQNDNIVLSGSMDYGQDSPTLWRYTSSGALDQSFGQSGTARISVSGDAGGIGLARDPVDGGYFVTGGVWSGSKMHLVKFKPDGSRDPTFNGGVVERSKAFGNNVIVDSQRRVIVTGYLSGATKDLAVWRFLPNGTLDASFGQSGVFTHAGAAGADKEDVGAAIVALPNDDLLVVGHSESSSDRDMVIWKLTAGAGQLDASFANAGVYISTFSGGAAAGQAIAVETGHRFVVAGYSQAPGDKDLTVWRFSSDGSLDSSFGQNGIYTDRIAQTDEGVHAIVVAGARLIVAGRQGEDGALWVLR
jgi:uncharacterized delta-60 repeat protein